MLQLLYVIVQCPYFLCFLQTVLPRLFVQDDAFGHLQHLRQDPLPGFFKDRKTLVFGGDHILVPAFPLELGVGGGLTDAFGSSHAV